MYPNRVIATLAPVFALAAGASATWLAEHFPGVNVPASALEEIFIAGAVVVLAPALQWLYGWQKHEARESEAELAVAKADAGVSDVTVKVDSEESGPDMEEFDFDSEDFDLGPDEDIDLGSDEDFEAVLAEADGGSVDGERADG